MWLIWELRHVPRIKLTGLTFLLWFIPKWLNISCQLHAISWLLNLSDGLCLLFDWLLLYFNMFLPSWFDCFKINSFKHGSFNFWLSGRINFHLNDIIDEYWVIIQQFINIFFKLSSCKFKLFLLFTIILFLWLRLILFNWFFVQLIRYEVIKNSWLVFLVFLFILIVIIIIITVIWVTFMSIKLRSWLFIGWLCTKSISISDQENFGCVAHQCCVNLIKHCSDFVNWHQQL